MNNIKKFFKIFLTLILIILFMYPVGLMIRKTYKESIIKHEVNLQRIEKVKLDGDIATISDFRPELSSVQWERKPDSEREIVYLVDISTATYTTIYLEPDSEKAFDGYSSFKKSILRHEGIQSEKVVGPKESYCIGKIRIIEQNVFPYFFYSCKPGVYFSEVTFVKNNMLVVMHSSSYIEKNGSGKQKTIDYIADYLEKQSIKKISGD